MTSAPTRKPRERSPRSHFPWWPAVLILQCCLPAVAILQVPDLMVRRCIAGAVLLSSGVTFLLYRSDKRKAQAGEWRVPESTLHLGECLGGWPGAFLAQRLFRHKNAKGSYQVVYWLIVGLYQFAAFDYLNRWRFSREMLAWVQR